MDRHPQTLIKILREDVARRIAAGEVIDRPAAVLRELLDNAVDAGAAEISCFLEDGGRERIRVVDNGSGMGKEDLSLSVLPHATSKITRLEDLDRLSTLGFRGEALASIASCARLEITSLEQDAAGPAYRILAEGGKQLEYLPSQGTPGTTVDAARLFFNMPARKKFLKSARAETALCKSVFTEKALAFPEISFKLWTDGKPSLFLPACPRVDRIRQVMKDSLPDGLFEAKTHQGETFSIDAVCAGPAIHGRDRRLLQIFVNRRRIYEYSLLQAVEYGYAGYLPGGLKPVAFVFISVNPEFVDFNIHPAKREARFRNLSEIHSALVLLVKQTLAGMNTRPPEAFSAVRLPDHPSSVPEFVFPARSGGTEEDRHAFFERAAPPTGEEQELRYLGQIDRTYLAAVAGGDLVLVDQHAAHERIIFDRLRGKPDPAQELLVPIAFETEEDQGAALAKNRETLASFGFGITAVGRLSFEVTALPGLLQGVPEESLILFLKNLSGSAEDLKWAAVSLIACRGALKAGERLDELSARELVTKALALPDPHCPHGRPVFLRFSKETLGRLFKRTV